MIHEVTRGADVDVDYVAPAASLGPPLARLVREALSPAKAS